jgi:hypothetical protein
MIGEAANPALVGSSATSTATATVNSQPQSQTTQSSDASTSNPDPVPGRASSSDVENVDGSSSGSARGAPVYYAPFPDHAPPLEARKRNSSGKAEFWSIYFVMEGEEYKNLAYCELCDKVGNVVYFKNHRKQGFKSLERHYQSHVKEGEVESKSDALRVIGFKPTAAHRDQILEGHAMFVSLDLRPLNAIEGRGFKHLMSSINRGWIPFSRETVGRKIGDIAQERRSLVSKHLRNQNMHYAITYDGWRDNSDRDWIGSTVHWIEGDWSVGRCVLDISPLPERHTADNVSSSIIGALRSCGLDIEKLISATTDNAANMVASVRQLRSLENPVFRIPCVAHTLNLIVQMSILGIAKDQNDPRLHVEEEDDWDNDADVENLPQGVTRLTTKLLKLITFLKRSKAGDSFRQYVGSVISPVKTRWFSYHRAFARILKGKDQFHLIEGIPENLKLSEDEWFLTKKLVQLLLIFVKAEKLLEGDKYPTSSLALFILATTRADLLKAKIEFQNVPAIYSRIVAALADLDSRFIGVMVDATVPAFGIAALLDPRFKSLDFLPSDDSRNMIKDLLRTKYLELKNQAARQTPVRQNANAADRDLALLHAAAHLEDGEYDLLAALNQREDAIGNNAVDELDAYLNIPEHPKLITKDTLHDPLMWWKDNEHRFPTLAKLARVYLCIPATSAPSERLFSSGGNLVSKKRCRLGVERVQDILYIHESQDVVDRIKRARRSNTERQ